MPLAAPEVWQQLLAESKASTAKQSKNILFATHPAPEERFETLGKLARSRDTGKGERGRDRYLADLGTMREQLVRDELALRQYGRSEVVFDRLLIQSPDDGVLWYGKGEVYRLRAAPEDLPRAIQAYEKALQGQGAPPETYRSMALVALKQGAKDRAQAALDSYVQLKPDASDVEALRALLAE
jgi:predicted Zn-dependent protease